MAFGDFKRLIDPIKKFKLQLQEHLGFFAQCPETPPSDFLVQALKRGVPLASAVGTEKVRSELIVVPMLVEVVAAQCFNQKEGNDVPAVYGVVTTGINWKFLALTEQLVTLDGEEYLISQPGRILGVLKAMGLGSAPTGKER